MKFFAFNYWDTANTTTGEPNTRTGKLSIAGEMVVFSNKAERDHFAEKRGYKVITAKQARSLKAGLSIKQFEEFCEHMIDDHSIIDGLWRAESGRVYKWSEQHRAYLFHGRLNGLSLYEYLLAAHDSEL